MQFSERAREPQKDRRERRYCWVGMNAATASTAAALAVARAAAHAAALAAYLVVAYGGGSGVDATATRSTHWSGVLTSAPASISSFAHSAIFCAPPHVNSLT